MKDGVRLLNFSRAELADFADLTAALESGKVASYVTDFPTQEVLQMKNAVVIPHLGASTPESEETAPKWLPARSATIWSSARSATLSTCLRFSSAALKASASS